MNGRGLAIVVLLSVGSAWAGDEPKPKPITVSEAIRRVDQEVFVEMFVQAAKNRLEKRGEIYLDSEPDFHDEKNLAVVILRDGAAAFKAKGIDDPAEHFRDQTVRVKGRVIVKEERPRIEITDAGQIEMVKKP
jgi:hypothetical protein